MDHAIYHFLLFPMPHLFPRFAPDIRNLDLPLIDGHARIPPAFLLDRDGPFEVNYIPFESVNLAARVVLVGLTPGFVQWRNAVAEAQVQLRGGASADEALSAAKRAGAFSGPIRPNLVALLDRIGLHRWLGLPGCATLFGQHAHLLHLASLLRHPVSRGGKNYSGTPAPIAHRFLRRQITEYFAQEAALFPDAVFIPLGPAVANGLHWLAKEGVLQPAQILDGLPHPSGANAERIAYFLGRKERSTLSTRTDPVRLDSAREALAQKLERLCGGTGLVT
ncbi:hypothetical protein [Pseudoduganella albidiflava]|uniref:Uracil-DNA glycosylase-like domain-containing protein n=2 Tax=Pseudoduganella albidiflava TaxID=321983 RepID=A0AA87XV90_9BURK|nr:hypothetical protein [Pseudoduganella albidiflava]GGY46464.1 hypothetical protein GCM10007387_30750 [Pseudoduganella albidiflava]